jgi:LPS sulfotransferase NodH
MQPNASFKTKAIRAVKRWWYDLRHVAEDVGLLPAHTGYTRFLILASARTGSTLLARSLNRHSQIVAYGEILRDKGFFPARFVEFGRSQGLYQIDPVAFLERKVYRKYPQDVAAVGFKIFYGHAPRDTAWGQAVWKTLTEQKTIKVLHLKRRNLLRAHLSRQQAAETREWIHYSAGRSNHAVTLSYSDTLAHFTRTRQQEMEYAALFAGHPVIDVYYEDLAAVFENEMARLQAFLGVGGASHEVIRPPTHKRPSQRLSDQVANYQELKTQFQDSPWAEFFEE